MLLICCRGREKGGQFLVCAPDDPEVWRGSICRTVKMEMRRSWSLAETATKIILHFLFQLRTHHEGCLELLICGPMCGVRDARVALVTAPEKKAIDKRLLCSGCGQDSVGK